MFFQGVLMGRLIILTGPSCAGKSPLCRALARLHPEMYRMLGKVVLYNCRAPRIGEIDGKDYHFAAREQVEQYIKNDSFPGMDVRGDLQALDIHSLARDLEKSDMLYEGNPYIAEKMISHSLLREFGTLGIFLSPLSCEEMRFIHAVDTIEPASYITEIMRKKLLRRMRKHKGELSLPDLQEIERRAGTAYNELTMAHRFGHIIVNHDGEDSENWNAFYYPLGDARLALTAFVKLLKAEPCATEHWGDEPWT
ncbi:MAG: hypothetical protein GF350_07230 [Chitinivibrionales bacterium]|nr:hypothetical protein [Chitinivibrionales bacterium]